MLEKEIRYYCPDCKNFVNNHGIIQKPGCPCYKQRQKCIFNILGYDGYVDKKKKKISNTIDLKEEEDLSKEKEEKGKSNKIKKKKNNK